MTYRIQLSTTARRHSKRKTAKGTLYVVPFVSGADQREAFRYSLRSTDTIIPCRGQKFTRNQREKLAAIGATIEEPKQTDRRLKQ